MERLVGRKKEIEILNSAYSSDSSELVALYGRRRVGKTFLVRKVFRKDIYFEVTGLYNGNMKDQLENFVNAISPKKIVSIHSWLDAFSLLQKKINRSRSKRKKVIFIDEFPWLSTARSKFLMAFEHFWNSYCTQRDDLLVVICGSAASFMIQKVLHNKGGLHNRVTQQIRLLPFSIRETKDFLESRGISYTIYDIVKLYMAIGGVPHYLEHLSKGKSVAQNIDALCFSKDGILRTEYEKLFTSLFHQPEKHLAIVEALATSKKGITRKEILRKSRLKSGGDFTQKLNELIESGFVEEYNYWGNKSQFSLYRLIDEYVVFYLKFIQPHKKLGKGTWQRLQIQQSYKIWSGFTFENLCLKHINTLKKALGIEGVYTTNSSWFNDEVQIDLLIDREDNVINVCEMKFYQTEFSIDKSYYQKLKNKIKELRSEINTQKNIFLTMVTSYGIKENKYSKELVQNTITIKEFFK